MGDINIQRIFFISSVLTVIYSNIFYCSKNCCSTCYNCFFNNKKDDIQSINNEIDMKIKSYLDNLDNKKNNNAQVINNNTKINNNYNEDNNVKIEIENTTQFKEVFRNAQNPIDHEFACSLKTNNQCVVCQRDIFSDTEEPYYMNEDGYKTDNNNILRTANTGVCECNQYRYYHKICLLGLLKASDITKCPFCHIIIFETNQIMHPFGAMTSTIKDCNFDDDPYNDKKSLEENHDEKICPVCSVGKYIEITFNMYYKKKGLSLHKFFDNTIKYIDKNEEKKYNINNDDNPYDENHDSNIHKMLVVDTDNPDVNGKYIVKYEGNIFNVKYTDKEEKTFYEILKDEDLKNYNSITCKTYKMRICLPMNNIGLTMAGKLYYAFYNGSLFKYNKFCGNKSQICMCLHLPRFLHERNRHDGAAEYFCKKAEKEYNGEINKKLTKEDLNKENDYFLQKGKEICKEGDIKITYSKEIEESK